jgi:hypothetical protein
LSVTNKKTEHDSNQQDHHEDNGDGEPVHITKRSKHENTDKTQESELMIEPKNEYDDDDEDEDGNVEDLTMDDEMMDDLDQAGPSHGGEGSSQGEFRHVKHTQWHFFLTLCFHIYFMQAIIGKWTAEVRNHRKLDNIETHKVSFNFLSFFFVNAFLRKYR